MRPSPHAKSMTCVPIMRNCPKSGLINNPLQPAQLFDVILNNVEHPVKQCRLDAKLAR